MIFDELLTRGLVKQSTNFDKVKHMLDHQEIRFYIGFDPTADSLHVGHLLQIITAKRLKNAGHTPIVLIGGATASVGDPTGKTDMRPMLLMDEIGKNSELITNQISNILGLCSHVNNHDWLGRLNFLELLSEVGRHFSVNQMLRAECFKSRMENSGLSFLEFNYMIMQAFDFFHLSKHLDCQLQIGGDDQWANIIAGIDLIHKKTGKEAFGLTLTLLTNSNGQKMGKTEKGAIWLDEEKTSIFDFFQFWRNMPDTEVLKCFKLLTFLSLEEIENIAFDTIANMNNAKKRLAFEMTKIVHGAEKAEIALKQAEALFETKQISEVEAFQIPEDVSILDLLVKCGFAKSKTFARNLIDGKGISINDETITDPTTSLSSSKFGKELMLRKGKKNFCRITIEDKQ